MYYFSVITIFIFSAFFLPIGAIASNSTEIGSGDIPTVAVAYDYTHARMFQVEGHSMETLGFAHNSYVNVVPVSDVNVGDVIAFTCTHEACHGAYIKRVAQKSGNCFWVEGRQDVWSENGVRKQSLDSRTTYGWLCNDTISIMGVAFTQNA